MKISGRVLIINASDASAATGVQADLKTVTALGGYGSTVITALTVRSRDGAFDALATPPDFVRRQIKAAVEDIGCDVIFCGYLRDAEMVDAVADALEAYCPDAPLVLDPIMVLRDGRQVLDMDGLRHLKIRLLPRATVLTPNLREAELMAGMILHDIDERRHATAMLLTLGAKAVLLTGGVEAVDSPVVDLLATEEGVALLSSDYIASAHRGGVGSSLAAAVACGLAQGMELTAAVVRARRYVRQAMLAAPSFGGWSGPINHAVTVTPFSGDLPVIFS